MDPALVEAVARSLGDASLSEVVWGAFIRLALIVAFQLAFWLVLVALAGLAVLAAWLILRPRGRRS